MEYHGNHYFTDVKISDFVAGRPYASCITKPNHMLHKILLFQANNAQVSHFK